jgi:two-component system, NarL family, nitrate/nitrite response regulator NarL
VTGIEDLLIAIRATARGELCFPWGAAPPPPSSAANTAVSWKLQRLTPREREVLAHVAAGHDNLKIAALLNISERTVKSHVISVYRKLDAENRVQLALLAGQLGVAAVRS